jgi:hypothetical protein
MQNFPEILGYSPNADLAKCHADPKFAKIFEICGLCFEKLTNDQIGNALDAMVILCLSGTGADRWTQKELIQSEGVQQEIDSLDDISKMFALDGSSSTAEAQSKLFDALQYFWKPVTKVATWR